MPRLGIIESLMQDYGTILSREEVYRYFYGAVNNMPSNADVATCMDYLREYINSKSKLKEKPMPTVTAVDKPLSAFEREKKEIEFITGEYKDKPYDFDTIVKAHKSGVLTKNSRNNEIKELVEVVENYNKKPVVFDYRKGGWKILHGVNQQFNGEPSSMNIYGHLWKHHVKKMSKGHLVLSDQNLQIATGNSREETKTVESIQMSPLFGIELEMYTKAGVNNTQRFSDALYELKEWGRDYVILHGDGSIESGRRDENVRSVEMVTVPLPLSELKKFIKNFCNSGIASKFEVNATCGLHIHMSRECFSFGVDGPKFFSFFHNADNKKFLTTIGRRDGSTYCRYLPHIHKKHEKGNIVSMFMDQETCSELQQHYAALSISTKHPTFECRIFKSTTDMEELLASVEFIDAICRFMMNTSFFKLSYKDFLTFVTDASNTRCLEKDRKTYKLNIHPEYRELINFMQKHNIIKVDDKQHVTFM